MSKRKVNRPDLPAEIRPRLQQWAQELKAECAAYAAAADPKPDRPTVDPDKYGHKKIRETLQRMYSGLCCYCESQVRVTSTQHVEHYHPKGRDEYLAEAYDWENLHQACEECNLTKADKFDPASPPVIPTDDDPLDHVDYEHHEIFGKDDRGWWNINEIDLARYELTEARAAYFKTLFAAVSEARRALHQLQQKGYVSRNSIERKLVEKAIGEITKALQPGAPYPTMIRANRLDQLILKLGSEFQALKFI